MIEIQRIPKTVLTGDHPDAERSKLRSVVRNLSDVLEAHAVHGDHSDAQLQEWANVGRCVVDDYKEETP